MAAKSAPRKNISSAIPLISVINATIGSDPYRANARMFSVGSRKGGISRTMTAPIMKTTAVASPSKMGRMIGLRSSPRKLIRPRCRSGGEPTDHPGRREGDRQRVEPRARRFDVQRDPKQSRTDHESDAD